MPYQTPPQICPVCKEKADFKFVQDYHKNKEREFSLYECSECLVQFWIPFECSVCKTKYIAEDIFNKPGYDNYFLNFVQNLPKSTKILDLGCGMGRLVSKLQCNGYDAWGGDIDRGLIDFGRKYFKIRNIYAMPCDEFLKLPDLPKFDIITFFEVIEHLDSPLEFIQNVKKLLKEDGVIVLSTPSRERFLARQRYADLPPNHLSCWNEEAISNLFKKINFKIAKVRYIDQFKWILGSLAVNFRFDMVSKIQELKENKRNIIVKETIFAKIVHFGAYLKDYILTGIPAIFLLLYGKLTNRKNGDMLIWLKKINP